MVIGRSIDMLVYTPIDKLQELLNKSSRIEIDFYVRMMFVDSHGMSIRNSIYDPINESIDDAIYDMVKRPEFDLRFSVR